MKSVSKFCLGFLYAFVICLLFGVMITGGQAGIHNNSGTSPEDSLAISFTPLDSIGSPVSMASGDSCYFVTFYPSGAVAFKDSMAFNNARITTYDFEDWNGAIVYSFKDAIANVDGGGEEGTYKYIFLVDDNTSASLVTSFIGEFQVYAGPDASANFSDKLDSVTQIPTGEITTGSFTAGAVNDAAVDNGVTLRANVIAIDDDSTASDNAELFFDGTGYAGTGNTIPTVTTVTNSIGTSLSAAEVDADVSTEIWASTGGDSVLQALDYTNNTHEVVRQVVSTVATVTTVANPISADVQTWNGDAVNTLQTGRVDAYVGALASTVQSGLSKSTADSVWEDRIAEHKRDSVFGGAYGYVPAGTRAFAVTDLDSTVGSLAEGTIENGAIDWGGELDTTGSATSTWSHGTRTLTSGSGLTIAAVAGLADTVRDVLGDTLNATSGKVYVALVDGLGDTLRDVVGDTFNVVSGNVSLTTASMGSTSDSVWAKDTSNTAWNGLLNTFGEWNAQAQAGAGSAITAGNMGSIADSVWAKDTSNTLWNGLLNKFGEWNAQAQTGSGAGACDCGNGAQTVTIKVADTSGTYVVVPNAKVSTIVGATSVWAITNGSGIATLYLDPGTFTAYAYANGYNFTAKSITVPASSYADSLLGYDVPTTGVAVPSSQQVTLYDWAISPANDTLYSAKVTITLAGSSNFFTTTHLVPSTSVVVYAGANDGTTNGGKWLETIFGCDSLFSPGGQAATYEIEINHPLLDLSGSQIKYTGLVIPANASSTRLRSIVAGQ